MEKFDLSQIKAGYLLVVENVDDHKVFNMTVVLCDNGTLGCCCPGDTWTLLEYFDNPELQYCWAKILRVYGPTAPKFLLDNSVKHRELLWKRPEEPKKMTVAEVCEALGYDVEIVEEDQGTSENTENPEYPEYKVGDKVCITGNWAPGKPHVPHFYDIGEEVEVVEVQGNGVLRCINKGGMEQCVHVQYVDSVKENGNAKEDENAKEGEIVKEGES